MYDGGSSGGLASARWADIDYIVNRYPFVPGAIWLGRNPHNFDDAIGLKNDKHVLVCAGSGAGKGRSVIVNNLALWPGSVAAYDPKGELPQILAARRGQGDDLCDGMEQEVFVLDPLGHSGVAREYLGFFDPLAGLDPDDGELPTWAKRIAGAVINIEGEGESAAWAKRAQRLIALMICHVVTYEHLEPGQRSLTHVLEMLLEGLPEQAEAIYNASKGKVVKDPMVVLLEEMISNKGVRGWVAKDARSLLRQSIETPKYFESIRGEATDQLDWFKSAGIEWSLKGYVDDPCDRNESRRFDPKRLKNDEHGVSVFVVMPVDDLDTYKPWVQAVFLGIFAAMRSVRGKPATGHQTLFVIDEFLSLGYQNYIATALDNIRGAGMKLMIVIQNFGSLKKNYGDGLESFQTNMGAEIFFGKIGELAGEYLKKQLGETEVVRTARSFNQSENESVNQSTAEAQGTTSSRGGSTAKGQSSAIGKTDGWSKNFSSTQNTSGAFNFSNNVNWSDSRNWGQSEGKNMGRNYGPHIYHQPLEKSTSYGTNLNRSRGGNATRGGGRQQGKTTTRGKSKTKTIGKTGSTSVTDTTSQTDTSSWNMSESFTQTNTRGSSKGYQIGAGVAETFHKKPLLDHHEMNTYFGEIEFEDRDHPAYPGLALIRINRENPFFVRRSNYDQDPYFEGCFSADPTHGFIPLGEQPMLGYQYTPEHIVEFMVPELMERFGFVAKPLVSTGQWVEKGAPLYDMCATEERFGYVSEDNKDTIETAVNAKILDSLPSSQNSEDGYFLTVRFERTTKNAIRDSNGGSDHHEVLDFIQSKLNDDESAEIAAQEKREAEENAEKERLRHAKLEEERVKCIAFWRIYFGLVWFAWLPAALAISGSTYAQYDGLGILSPIIFVFTFLLVFFIGQTLLIVPGFLYRGETAHDDAETGLTLETESMWEAAIQILRLLGFFVFFFIVIMLISAVWHGALWIWSTIQNVFSQLWALFF